MSNGFTREALVDAIEEAIDNRNDVDVSLRDFAEAAVDALPKECVASLNASTTLATMGYDAVECMKALPELLERIEVIARVPPVSSEEFYQITAVYLGRVQGILTRLRVQEVDNG